jgi:type II secretory pathway pseudopilin PulG
VQTDRSLCTHQERLRAGFTAIEMMVVVSIIIVLVAMVVPTIGPAMKKGAVHDAASAIQRACSQARQLARSNTEPRAANGANPKWYGVAVVVPSEANKPAYAVVIYGNQSIDYGFANQESNQYPNSTPDLSAPPPAELSGYKPAAKFPFSRNVMPVMDQTAGTTPAYAFMTAGTAVGWYYQYRTGFVFNDVSKPTAGVDIGVPDSKTRPEALGVASLDRKYIVAIAVYKIGLMNAQDAN